MVAASILGAGRVDLSWHPHISVWLIMGALAAGYWYAFTRLGPRILGPGVPVATKRERNWVIAGLAAMYVFADYPIHDISEKYLFFVHMLQHTVFTLVAPACLLLGTPAWLQQRILEVQPIGAVVRVMTKPLIALLAFNALVAGTHFPAVVEKSLHNEFVHFTLHAVLFLFATFMWFPVINRIPGFPQMKPPLKMMYLFGQSIVPTVPASFLTVSTEPLYKTYEAAPRMIHGFDAVGDQQVAAAIMKVGGGMLLWSIVGYLFMKWWQDSQRGNTDDNLRPIPVAPPAPVPADTDRPVGSAHPEVDAGSDEELLTWEHVQAEFDRLEKEPTTPE